MAQNLIKGWKEPYTDVLAGQYRWKLLRVGLDGLTFWGNSIRISDLLARQELVEKTLDRIKQLLEITYPLGLEVYRDENGSIFVVPDVDKFFIRFAPDKVQTLDEYLQVISGGAFSGEATLSPGLSSSTRNMLSFGSLVMKPVPPPNPSSQWLKEKWQEETKRMDVCPVCGLRPQGPSTKARDRKVCDVCEQRRINRSLQWLSHLSTTIWADEIADVNGRFALIVGQFDLSSWLSGSSFNTVLAFDPQKTNLAQLTVDIQEGLRRDTNGFRGDSLLKRLVPGIIQRRTNYNVRAFYNLRILDTDLEHDSSLTEPQRLMLEMVRLSPSFSRVSRVWETTQTFWEESSSSFMTRIDRRLKLRGVFVAEHPGQHIYPSHTYELKVDTVSLSVVCVTNEEFITADNLQRVAVLLGGTEADCKNYQLATKYIVKRIQNLIESNKEINLEEPTGYGNLKKQPGRLRPVSVEEVNAPYLPAIFLLKEPRVFMALVPAENALDFVQIIKEKYQREMNKVRNRFSLSLGITFAGRRSPLPAILDAGRCMLKQPSPDDMWKVVQKVEVVTAKSAVIDEVLLTLEKEGQQLHIKTKIVMGDGRTEDVWYPYWCVEIDKDGNRPTGRKRQFVGEDGKAWVHIRDLRSNDVVYFSPSRFDFEFLETAAQRFEISYKDGKRRSSSHPRRPYYLEELDDIVSLWKILADREGLTTSQIYNLIELIEGTRVEWQGHWDQDTFERIVRDALDEAGWEVHPRKKPDPNAFKKLCQAAISGQLADVVELYMRILKKKPERDQ